jgi:hypothetical protein
VSADEVNFVEDEVDEVWEGKLVQVKDDRRRRGEGERTGHRGQHHSVYARQATKADLSDRKEKREIDGEVRPARHALLPPEKADARGLCLQHLYSPARPATIIPNPERLLENGLSDGEEEGVDEAEVAKGVLTRLISRASDLLRRGEAYDALDEFDGELEEHADEEEREGREGVGGSGRSWRVCRSVQ